MRDEYRADLLRSTGYWSRWPTLCRSAMSRATKALLTADQTEAEEVVARDAEINALYRLVEDKVYDLLRPPGAGRLRPADGVHRAARRDRPRAHGRPRRPRREDGAAPATRLAVPVELPRIFEEMGAVADRIAGKITRGDLRPRRRRAGELDRDDDEMDQLHTQAVRDMFGPNWADGTEAAVDARCSAASTSATPTTPSTPAGTWCSSSPASAFDTDPARKSSEEGADAAPPSRRRQRPWLATAAAASLAASGSRYAPPARDRPQRRRSRS